jgi:hypothetical protein
MKFRIANAIMDKIRGCATKKALFVVWVSKAEKSVRAKAESPKRQEHGGGRWVWLWGVLEVIDVAIGA